MAKTEPLNLVAYQIDGGETTEPDLLDLGASEEPQSQAGDFPGEEIHAHVIRTGTAPRNRRSGREWPPLSPAADREVPAVSPEPISPPEQIPDEHKIEAHDETDDIELPDDWRECLAALEEVTRTSQPPMPKPQQTSAPETDVLEKPSPEPVDDRISFAKSLLTGNQDTPQRNNGSLAMGPISDILRTRPASLEPSAQPPAPKTTPPPKPQAREQAPRIEFTEPARDTDAQIPAEAPPPTHVQARRAPVSEISILSLYKDGRRDFSGIDLQEANLQGASLENARLIMANLREAEMSHANLSGVRLVKADLRGASLTGAKLDRAKLAGARLNRAVLRNADLKNADLSDTDLSEADLLGANLLGAKLTGAKLHGARLDDNWRLIWEIVNDDDENGHEPADTASD